MLAVRPSFYIKKEGTNHQAVKEGLAWLHQNSKKKGFLAVMVYGNLEGIISDILGEETVKKFIKDGALRINGKEMVLVTMKKRIYSGDNEPILLVYPNEKFLDEIDSIHNVSAMLVVPWNFQEIELWIKTHNATELGQPKKEEPELIRNKVVVRALESLVNHINISTGIIHPSDKEAAIWTFTILRDGGEYFNPDEIKAWLIRYGNMRASYAQDVADIAKAVLEGRKLKKGIRHWRDDILEIWREEAKTKQS